TFDTSAASAALNVPPCAPASWERGTFASLAVRETGGNYFSSPTGRRDLVSCPSRVRMRAASCRCACRGRTRRRDPFTPKRAAHESVTVSDGARRPEHLDGRKIHVPLAIRRRRRPSEGEGLARPASDRRDRPGGGSCGRTVRGGPR